jgi:hypothetical protein
MQSWWLLKKKVQVIITELQLLKKLSIQGAFCPDVASHFVPHKNTLLEVTRFSRVRQFLIRDRKWQGGEGRRVKVSGCGRTETVITGTYRQSHDALGKYWPILFELIYGTVSLSGIRQVSVVGGRLLPTRYIVHVGTYVFRGPDSYRRSNWRSCLTRKHSILFDFVYRKCNKRFTNK